MTKLDQILPQIRAAIVCPACHGELEQADGDIRCTICGDTYPETKDSQIDFRLKRPLIRSVDFVLAAPVPRVQEFSLDMVDCDFSAMQIGTGVLPPAPEPHALFLDLGCGSVDYRTLSASQGYEYIGIDYDSPEATFLADAHALPFRTNSISFTLSMAVLEHLQYPFVAIREVQRILKTGCRFFGTVAFQEPCHGNSYYHHSHLGTLNTLLAAGFEAQKIVPNDKWPLLVAQAYMVLFPKMPPKLSRCLIMPLHWLHLVWWRLVFRKQRDMQQWRRLCTAGAIYFLAMKPLALNDRKSTF